MRKILCFVFSGFLVLPAVAQSADSTRFKMLLFDRFSEGRVLMKSGRTEKALFNYNTDDQSLVFQHGDAYMTLVGLEEIDTIYLQQKKFIPLENKILEVLPQPGPALLYATYSGKTRPLVATTDHNGSAQRNANEVSNTITDVYARRNFKGQYEVEIQKQYWIRNGNTLARANTKNQLLKLFPRKSKTAVENYMASQRINLQNEADLIRLVRFCSQQP